MHEELTQKSTIELVRQLLAGGEAERLRRYLESFHASDLADLIESLDEDERAPCLRVLPDGVASETLAEMEESAHPETLLLADPERVPELIHELADDDAADIIGDLPPEKQREVLAQLPVSEAGELRELLAHDEESAGGVMTTEVVVVSERVTVSAAIEAIRDQSADVGDFYNVFVVDKLGCLRGTVSLQDLIVSPPGTAIADITELPLAVVPATMDQEDVARVMSRYNLVSVPVVDPLERLIGRVTFDDVMDIIEAETTEDMLRLAGGSGEEHLRGGVGEAIKSRLPWLFVNLITAALAAAVVWAFQSTVQRIVLLAVAMPVIAGMGGNAGTQALAVTVRRLAVSSDRSGGWKVIRKEIAVGLINGAAVGLLVGLAGYLFLGGSAFLGLVVMLAMWLNLVVAGFAGGFVPVFLEGLGVDPAVASSVFVTALTDIFGFLFLLGLGSWILLPRL